MGRIGLSFAIGVAVLGIAWVVLRGARDVSPDPLPDSFVRTEAARAEAAEVLRLAPPPALPERPATASGYTPPVPWASNVKAYLDSGPCDACFDLVFVGDGYRQCDLDDGTYWADVERHASAVLATIPFCWYRRSINVRAVFLTSKMEGCDVSSGSDRVDTALDSVFEDSKDRYLKVRNVNALRDVLRRAGDVDALLVMVNTRFFGGTSESRKTQLSGSAVRVAVFSPRQSDSERVAIHELGHSVGRLEDEYESPGDVDSHRMPRAGKDLEGMNVQVDESIDRSGLEALTRTAKWGHFLGLPGAEGHRWAHQGGYYRSVGTWRPWRVCCMRSHGDPFCPVCCEEVAKRIVWATGLSWDDKAYHAAHPLSLWTE